MTTPLIVNIPDTTDVVIGNESSGDDYSLPGLSQNQFIQIDVSGTVSVEFYMNGAYRTINTPDDAATWTNEYATPIAVGVSKIKLTASGGDADVTVTSYGES